MARQVIGVTDQLVRQQYKGGTKHTHDLSDLTRREKKGIDFSAASYKKESDRAYKMHGYTYSSKYSNEKFAVYKRGDKFHIGIRGTSPDVHKLVKAFVEHKGKQQLKQSDIGQDYEILKGTFSMQSSQMKDAQGLMDKILEENPNSMGKLQISGHSLAARQVLELMNAHPDYYKDSVAISPGFSPLGTSESQEHMKKLVQGHKHKSHIIANKNDVVWQSAEKYMTHNGKANKNVKIFKAIDTSLHVKGLASNHFLSAFDYKKKDTKAHERLEKLLTKHGFSQSDIDKHVETIKTFDEKKGHAKVDRIQKKLAGSLKAKRWQRPKMFAGSFDVRPSWYKKKDR